MTRLAAILNITPDSFSGDGAVANAADPVSHAEAAIAAGAHMLDIGAQSTRPGASVIGSAEEISRLSPYLKTIAALCDTHGVLCSVDTYHADTAAFAITCGAHVINDVSAGLHADGSANNEMLHLIKAHPHIIYIFMHHVTVPADKSRIIPEGADPVRIVTQWRDARIKALENAGLDRTNIIFDPGIGFGKNVAQSLALMQAMPQLCACDIPVMIGHSRKTFLGGISGEDHAAKRDPETVAASLFAAQHGAAWLRVHAINNHVRAFAVHHALSKAEV